MVLILECIVICFILFIPCVIVIANGAHNGVFLYEKDVQERVVQMGLITKEKIDRNAKLFKGITLPWNCQEMCSQRIPKICNRQVSGGLVSQPG